MSVSILARVTPSDITYDPFPYIHRPDKPDQPVDNILAILIGILINIRPIHLGRGT